MTIRSASLALALSLAAAASAQAQTKRVKVMGFYPDYSSGGISNTQAGMLSHTIYFSIKPPADGNVTDEYIINSIDAQRMMDMVDVGKTKGMGVLLCVGGAAESAGFPGMAGNATARKKFASTLADFCVTNGLHGVDIDWEFPGGAGSYSFQELAKDLKAAFGPKKLLVTASVNGPDNAQYTNEALQALDGVLIMSYDNDWPPGSSPHSTLAHAQQHLTAYANKVAGAKNKLILGVPFYGKASGQQPKSYKDILAANPGLDPAADNGGGFNFNGTSTLAQKTQYVIDQGYGGIMIWNLVQDANDFRLLSSINKAIKDKGSVVDQFTPVVSNHRIRRTVYEKYAIRPWNGQGRVKMHGEGHSRLSLYSPDGRGLGSLNLTQDVQEAPLPRASGRILYRVESSGSSNAIETGSASFTGR